MRRYVYGLSVLALCVAAFTVSCRRNQPSLVDTNQPPDTQLWYAPPDSTEYQYLVHLYWRGLDNDGTTQRFIWTIQDTLVIGEQVWNPSLRLVDFRQGRITTRTDSVFSFTAYKDVAGVGVRKNRQAFHIAAIDDNGVIDPEPAAIEFVATIGKLPEMRFVNYIDGVARPYTATPVPRDTVGMFRPFDISYHGITTNGQVRAYLYFPLSSTVIVPGSNIWNTDTSATLVSFPNTGVDALPAGVFRFAARCLDDAGAESQVDAGQYRVGVSQIVVNFDPDTWLLEVRNTAFKAGEPVVTNVNFTDSTPDTVPFMSWIYYRYTALDDGRDVRTCSLTDPDKCLDFQVRFVRTSARFPNATENSNWLPRNGTHDSDLASATDSNSVNIGSVEYQFFARSIDENRTPDGTPPSFRIVGNFDPMVDSYGLRDHFNDPVNVAIVDTMVWDFNNPLSTGTDAQGRIVKRFGWTLSAAGHDDPRDPDGSSIQAWRYFVYTNYNPSTNSGTFWPLGRAGSSWFPASSVNTLSDNFVLSVAYTDPEGDDLFANLPGYFNQPITIVLYGRDTASLSGDFSQYMFWTPAGSGANSKNLINAYPTGELGRWSPVKVFTFYLKFVR